MPAWSFKARFRERLLNGLAEAEGKPFPFPDLPAKRQTLRAFWANGHDPRPGQVCRIWIAQRTPGRELLGETGPIRRDEIEIRVDCGLWQRQREFDRWHRVKGEGAERLARQDGFGSFDELLAFFELTHALPFEGYRYRW